MIRSAAARRVTVTASSCLSTTSSRASCGSLSLGTFSSCENEQHSRIVEQQKRQQFDIAYSQPLALPSIWNASNRADGHANSNHKKSYSGGGGGGGYGRGGGNRNNHRNNHEIPTCAYISALASIMGLYVLSHIDDEAEDIVMSTKVTWDNMLQMVQDGKVEKIVVTDNNSIARLYVFEDDGGKKIDNKRVISDEATSHHQDTTQMHFGDVSQNAKATTVVKNKTILRSSTFHHDGIEPPSKSTAHHTNVSSCKVYHLNIDKSFEEKLEDAQRQFGRSRSNFIPVQYRPDNTTDESPVLTAVARIALIGVVTGMTRIITKRPGAGFGGGISGLSAPSLDVVANSRIGASLGQIQRMRTLCVMAMVPLLTRLPRSWTHRQPTNSWRNVFTYLRK